MGSKRDGNGKQQTMMNIDAQCFTQKVGAAALGLFTMVTLVLGTLQVSASQNKPEGCLNFTDSITIKSYQGKKNQVTKLYSDAAREVLYFSSTGFNGKAYQIYVFHMDGKLATVARVSFKETTLLVQLQKGNYLYEVFSNDDRIENGSITLR